MTLEVVHTLFLETKPLRLYLLCLDTKMKKETCYIVACFDKPKKWHSYDFCRDHITHLLSCCSASLQRGRDPLLASGNCRSVYKQIM